LVVASDGTVIVDAVAYVQVSDTSIQPSQLDVLAPKSIELSASLEPAIAAPALMFVLSTLPLNSLAIVLIGLFTSEASAVVPSDTCVGDIRPIIDSFT